MKIMKKITASILTMSLALLAVTPVHANGAKPKKIAAYSSQSVTVHKGNEFELKVKLNPLNAEDDYLRWSIVSGKGVVKFTDSDLRDDEVDLRAVKTGTAKVRCKIAGTNKNVDFTIKVKNSTATGKLTCVGPKKRSVFVGEEFELEVKKSAGVREADLRWSIDKPSIVGFEDNEHDADDETDFIARKKGTATITCKDKRSGSSVSFIITVR